MKALYVGYSSGTENHGDEALLWIIRDMLAPEIEVVTETDSFDIALLGGGTLINQSPWLIDFFETSLNKAKIGLVFGTGVGDLDFWGNHFDRWVPLLKRCAAVGVRGPQSQKLLQDHGFDEAQVCGDPYLWLHAPIIRKSRPKLLGVNLGSTNNAVWGTTDAGLFDSMFSTLQSLKSHGWHFHFFSVWQKDLPMLEDLHRRLQLGTDSLVIDVRADPLRAYSALAECQVFVGEKLHANAMATVAGVPFVALEYQPKVRDFAASLDMEAWVVSTAEQDPLIVAEKICELAEIETEVRRKLAATHTARRNDLCAFTQHVKKIIQQIS